MRAFLKEKDAYALSSGMAGAKTTAKLEHELELLESSIYEVDLNWTSSKASQL